MPNIKKYGPRHREELNQKTVMTTVTVNRFNAPTTTGAAIIGVEGTNRVMDDWVIENFRSEQARGVIFNNPCSWTKDSISRSQCPMTRVTSNIPRDGDIIDARWGASPLAVPPADPALYSLDWERLRRLACTAALGGIAPPDATSLLTLGELGETLTLIRNPIGGLTNSFKNMINLKRKYFKMKAAGVAAEAVANEYLAVMFGMQPLIADINMYIGLLSRFVPPRRTARGKAQDSSTRRVVQRYEDPWGQPFIGHTTLEGTLEVYVRAGSLYEYSCQDTISAMLGLRLSDVPIALWQLTRFSFLVDWAFNVGSTIRALTPVAGVHRLAEWYTVRSVCTETIKLSMLYHKDVPGWSGSAGGDTVTRVVESYTRYPCNLGDYVGLTYNIKWNPTKTLLSLALLTQTISTWARGKQIPLPQHRG